MLDEVMEIFFHHVETAVVSTHQAFSGFQPPSGQLWGFPPSARRCRGGASRWRRRIAWIAARAKSSRSQSSGAAIPPLSRCFLEVHRLYACCTRCARSRGMTRPGRWAGRSKWVRTATFCAEKAIAARPLEHSPPMNRESPPLSPSALPLTCSY